MMPQLTPSPRSSFYQSFACMVLAAGMVPTPLLFSADVTPAKAKTAPRPTRTTAEYDQEAAIRTANFTKPDDIQVSLFADESQTQNPSAICFDHQGRLYIAEIHRWRDGVEDIRNQQFMLADDIAIQKTADRLAMYQKHAARIPMEHYTAYEDRIIRVEDADGNGRADKVSVFADGFRDPLDGPGIGVIAGEDGSIYYTDIPRLWRLQDKDGDGTAEVKTVIQDGFGPRMSLSGHDMHGLAWGPDGRLYWSIGDRGYSFTTKEGRHYHRPMEGAVFRCDPDGSNVEEYYRGLRNPQELAFDEFGNLFTCDNDADSWDTGRLVYILEGGSSGWNHGHQALLIFRNQLGVRTPDYAHPGRSTIPMNPWMTEGLWEPRFEGRPEWALPPIDKISWGPSGLVYNYGATALPARYARHFFVCNFGGSKGDLETFTAEPDGAGFKSGDHHVFMVGLGNTDVEFGPDGKMYLSCFNNNGWYKENLGNIYSLYSKEESASDSVQATKELLLSDIAAKSAEDLGAMLGHVDLRVRQRAQFALAAQGGDAARRIFETAAADTSAPLLKRLHGIWGLGQLARKDPALLSLHTKLLTDPEAEVRAQSAKVLADSRQPQAGLDLIAALQDASLRVRAFAAIGVGKCRNAQSQDALLALLAENDNQDAFLRHACIQGLFFLHETERLLKKVDDPSAAVRLGVLLTLRQWEDPRCSYFLNDPEERIRYEAIRAIHDLDLPVAQKALAAHLDRYLSGEGVRPPENHIDQIIQLRLLNANFRLGKKENAARLLTYAANPKLPELCRDQALAALAEWPSPLPVDAVVGIHRPLDPAQREDITEVVREGLSKVFDNAGGHLLARALKLALQYEAPAPADLLTKELGNVKSDPESRAAALRLLASRNADLLAPMIDGLLKDQAPVLRAEMVKVLLGSDPDRGLAAALALGQTGNLRDRQNAHALLAKVPGERASQWFATALDDLQAGREPEGSRLDLLEAAAERGEPDIKAHLDRWNQSLDPADPLAAYRPTLAGGDADRGREIFNTHAAAQCAKCHRVNGGEGGEAGPDLGDIAKRQPPDYRLMSLVNPSAVVVPGYGIMLVTLKDGTSLGGTMMEENPQNITLKVPNPENASELIQKKIPVADIASRTPPVSAMPPMTALLTKREMRDVLAYLDTLKGK